VSSRIDLSLSPCTTVGLIASLPWLAFVAFVLVAFTPGQAIAGLAFALAMTIRDFRRLGQIAGGHAITGLRVRAGQLFAIFRDESEVPVRPGPASRLGAGLTLLKLHPSGTRFKAYHVILLAPSRWSKGNVVAPDQFRRLRQWLRLGKPRRSTDN
jgi:toxin CptA